MNIKCHKENRAVFVAGRAFIAAHSGSMGKMNAQTGTKVTNFMVTSYIDLTLQLKRRYSMRDYY